MGDQFWVFLQSDTNDWDNGSRGDGEHSRDAKVELLIQKTFEIQFQGGQLVNTDVLDSDHFIKMWWMPAETRKRGIEDNTKVEVPILFAIHVQPKLVMEFD